MQPTHSPKLDLQKREGGDGVLIPGLSVQEFTNKQGFFDIYDPADARKVMRETKMNATSSRGHTLLVLHITKIHDESSLKGNLNGQLIFADLAGFERLTHTMLSGVAKDEAASINLSLQALADVIHALNFGADYVPYRNSSLTRILEKSLSGNSMTSCLLTLSPTSLHLDDTMRTLYFGQKAIQCTTSIRANVGPVDYRRELIRLQAENSALQQKLTQLADDHASAMARAPVRRGSVAEAGIGTGSRRASVASAGHDVANFAQQDSLLQMELDEVTALLCQKYLEVEQLLAQSEEHEKLIDKLAIECSMSKDSATQLSELDKQNEALASDLQASRNELMQMKSAKDKLQKQYDASQAQYAKLATENSALRNQNAEQSGMLDALRMAKGRASDGEQQIQAKLTETLATLQKTRDRANEWEGQVYNMQRELSALRSHAKMLEEERQHAKLAAAQAQDLVVSTTKSPVVSTAIGSEDHDEFSPPKVSMAEKATEPVFALAQKGEQGVCTSEYIPVAPAELSQPTGMDGVDDIPEAQDQGSTLPNPANYVPPSAPITMDSPEIRTLLWLHWDSTRPEASFQHWQALLEVLQYNPDLTTHYHTRMKDVIAFHSFKARLSPSEMLELGPASPAIHRRAQAWQDADAAARGLVDCSDPWPFCPSAPPPENDPTFPAGRVMVQGLCMAWNVLEARTKFTAECEEHSGGPRLRWYRVPVNGLPSDEGLDMSQMELVQANNSPQYSIRTEDAHHYIVAEYIPVRVDGMLGAPVFCRTPFAVLPSVPCVANVTIAGSPVCGETVRCGYIFAGGQEGTCIFRWFKSLDTKVWLITCTSKVLAFALLTTLCLQEWIEVNERGLNTDSRLNPFDPLHVQVTSAQRHLVFVRYYLLGTMQCHQLFFVDVPNC